LRCSVLGKSQNELIINIEKAVADQSLQLIKSLSYLNVQSCKLTIWAILWSATRQETLCIQVTLSMPHALLTYGLLWRTWPASKSMRCTAATVLLSFRHNDRERWVETFSVLHCVPLTTENPQNCKDQVVAKQHCLPWSSSRQSPP